MKIKPIVLLNLAMLLSLSLLLSGCTRSRSAPTAVQAAAGASAPVVESDQSPALLRPSAAVASAPAAASVAQSPPVAQSDPVERPIAAPLSALSVSQQALSPDLPPLSRTLNILLLGSDRRPNQPNWRTDVLMLIALDMEGDQAAAISLPRDIYIDEIPGHQPNKINVIDYLGDRDNAGGGAQFLASILEEKIGIPIDYYLRFDFAGFEQVVDALNGVELSVECRVYEYLPEEDIDLYLEPGTHRLEGKLALGYVRARNQGGDLERARRQQRMVWAVRNQLVSENQLPHIPALYAALRDSVQTDIGFMDAIRFARFAMALSEDDIHGMVVAPPEMLRPDWRLGMSVFVADWPLIAQQVQTVFDRPPLVQTNTVGAEGDRVRCP